MMGPEYDLPTLVKRNDHLQVLRYIRVHELREPKLVIEHGKALLGDKLSKSLDDDAPRLAALEQICLAALDMSNHELAELCLSQLKESGGSSKKAAVINPESARFRRLLARCLEASGDYTGATKIYDALLRENPANLLALQRKYCIARAMNGNKSDKSSVITALNDYLGQNMSDTSGWYEMSQLRLSMADYKGAAYALEQVVLGCPLESNIHMKLGEVYATIGGLENLSCARKHMSQALELNPNNVRAQFGLVSIANQYLEESAAGSKKDVDEHEILVAKELLKYGSSKVLESYKGGKLYSVVQKVMKDYTDNVVQQE